LKERLREEKKILKFKLGTRDDDFSILLKEDYIEQIENLKTKQPESSKLFGKIFVFSLSIRFIFWFYFILKEIEWINKKSNYRWFFRVCIRITNWCFYHKERFIWESQLYRESNNVFELIFFFLHQNHLFIFIRILVQTGLLLLKDVESYWLSIPHFGIFIQYVVKGRDEILKTLKKRRNGEVMEEVYKSFFFFWRFSFLKFKLKNKK